ncbi:DUF3806 domain-containing protein [Pseudohalioglobus lutimaris]|uniref:DUF3806 domain-containing protein n=1 Tax=Pseudohalioglobus lutimaris TaxID=1737061 RepID=A0A2N5X6B1_9GAMM|nr:DUF3806 domain-containing protein [Pseudohalioglobus lutimaris]PLW70018.1 DUF3806 domain-containing protein [Pseudohalioglobus lutimaris]
MLFLRTLTGLALLLGLAVSTPGNAQGEAFISDLSYLDRQFMQQQRESLDDLAARNLGNQFSGERDRDLALLQRMLDEGLVRDDQTRELQAMGIIMGDLLAAELGLDWVIYEDRLGRTRALRYKSSDNYLFPVTMIARRREAGNRTPVIEVYRKAQESLSAVIPALPFR